MNVFHRIGMEHLSPSTCNLFASSPAMFVLEKIFKKKSSVGCAAHRGTAVETGIVFGLCNDATLEACQELAKREFEKLTALSGDPRRDKEGAALTDMVELGLKELKPYGCPTSTQGEVEFHFEGIDVPLIGRFDLFWEDSGIILDIKTIHALPSKIKTAHARQVAFYAMASGQNYDARITYITPKKVVTYRLENINEQLNSLRQISKSIQDFLSVSADPKELAALVVPDIDSFYFSDPITRQAAYDLWGI